MLKSLSQTHYPPIKLLHSVPKKLLACEWTLYTVKQRGQRQCLHLRNNVLTFKRTILANAHHRLAELLFYSHCFLRLRVVTKNELKTNRDFQRSNLYEKALLIAMVEKSERRMYHRLVQATTCLLMIFPEILTIQIFGCSRNKSWHLNCIVWL